MKFQTHAEAQAAINTLHSSRTLPVSPNPLLPGPSLPLAHLPGPGTEQNSIQDRTSNLFLFEFSQKNQQIKYHIPYYSSRVPIPFRSSPASSSLSSDGFSTLRNPPHLLGCRDPGLEAPPAQHMLILLSLNVRVHSVE